MGPEGSGKEIKQAMAKKTMDQADVRDGDGGKQGQWAATAFRGMLLSGRGCG